MEDPACCEQSNRMQMSTQIALFNAVTDGPACCEQSNKMVARQQLISACTGATLKRRNLTLLWQELNKKRKAEEKAAAAVAAARDGCTGGAGPDPLRGGFNDENGIPPGEEGVAFDQILHLSVCLRTCTSMSLRKSKAVLLLLVQYCMVSLGCSVVNMRYILMSVPCTSSLSLAFASSDLVLA